MRGLPLSPGCHATSANLSACFEANRLEIGRCCSLRMLIAKCAVHAKSGKLPALRAMQTSTSGGSSETEVKELAVKPRGRLSSSMAVTTVTPVTKQPKARRSSSGSSTMDLSAARAHRSTNGSAIGCDDRLIQTDFVRV